MEDIYPKQPTQTTTPPPSEPNYNNLPHKPHHFLTKKVAILIIIFLLISLFSLAGAYYVLQVQKQSQTPPPANSQNKSAVTPTPTKPASTDPLYESVYNWQLNYPSSLTVRELKPEELQSGILEQVNFMQVGKTQAEGTEFFDGLSFNVSVAQKQPDQVLQAFAKEMSQPDPQIGTLDYFREITVNGVNGYTSQQTGLGTITYIFLPRGDDQNTVIWISYMSVGPDKVMYDQMLQKMLGTLTIQEAEQKACTMEAKLCPDGSSVGRSGPNCEFAACPTN